MPQRVAEQILANWLEIFSTYMEIHSLDVEVVLRAEINELKHLRSVLCRGPKEKQLIEFNEYGTLTMKYGIVERTMTSNEETKEVIYGCVM